MIVIDASAAFAVVSERTVVPALLDRLRGVEEFHAPALIDFEVANAARGNVLGRLIDEAQAQQALNFFAFLPIQRHPLTSALGALLALRDNFTAYDAAYIVLAQALEAPLVTMDAKLTEARRLGVEVELYPPVA